ncbi:MAG: hypothetical protein VYE64_00500 [Planctomycetota bacterium]|nr:hypothetical protein [Planctomycetota bacterium]
MSSSDHQPVEQLTSELSQKRTSIQRRMKLTLVVGALALAALTTYFAYGYYQLNEVTRSTTLVNFAKAEFDRQLNDLQRVAENEIIESAPPWAAQTSEELVEQIPAGRQSLESWLKKNIDQQLTGASTVTHAKFQEMLQANRPDLERAIRSMTSEDGSDKFAEELLPLLEREAGVDMRQGAMQALGTLSDINHQLDRLAANQNLNETEQQMRYVLGLVKSLQQQQIDLNGG